MAERHQITCINKSDRTDPHDRITNVGGTNGDGSRWSLTQVKAIDGTENGTWQFYVSVNGQMVDVIVANRNGRKYLKTRNDGEQPNNLLSLRECP